MKQRYCKLSRIAVLGGFLIASYMASLHCSRRVTRPKPSVQSFTMSVIQAPPEGLGSRERPLPYVSKDDASQSPLVLKIRLQAIGWDGKPDNSFNGKLFLEARPAGSVVVQNPDKDNLPSEITVQQGVSEVSVALNGAVGATRLWVEDCGVRTEAKRKDCNKDDLRAGKLDCMPTFTPGTLATGVSPPIYFALPTLQDVQRTQNNTTSPFVPVKGDRCASLADPRYLDDAKRTSQDEFDRPALLIPKIGSPIQIESGTLIVNSIVSSGFYLTDLQAYTKGFHSLYVFNFGYPDNLEVGDILTKIQGSPTEFNGATQIQNPNWVKKPGGPFKEMIPNPIYISSDLYRQGISRLGRNVNSLLELEKLEGALVCMDNLTLPQEAKGCDLNNDGRIDRSEATGAESLCEQDCYRSPTCSEKGAFESFKQWNAYITGTGDATLRVAIALSEASPEFSPFKYVDALKKQNKAIPKMTVVGNLIHLLGSRPVWIIQPRGRDDYALDNAVNCTNILDRDGDGLNVYLDRCPKEAGLPNNGGCPPGK